MRHTGCLPEETMSLHSSLSTGKSKIALLPAIMLLVVSLAGIVHSARAAAAHVIYYTTRYYNEQKSRRDPGYTSIQCRKASALYPYNYYFHMWAADNSYYHRVDEDGKEMHASLEDAEKWCDAGLANNKWKKQLRFLKARLIAESSPLEAAAYLEDYVDWDFWSPSGHALLVEFYAKGGMIEKANAEIKWVKGSRYYSNASRALEAASERQTEMPPVVDDNKERQ